MEDQYKTLDKDSLVDLLANYTEQFTHLYIDGAAVDELNRLKAVIRAIQKEIFSREAVEAHQQSGDGSLSSIQD